MARAVRTVGATSTSDVITGDGHQKVAVVARQDPYGTGLAGAAQKSVEAAGGQVVKKVVYDPNAQSYDNEVDQLGRPSPTRSSTSRSTRAPRS